MTETTAPETPPVEVPAAEAPPTEAPESSHAEEATPAKMHRWSSYLHVGPGAAECPDGENGACTEKEHFHAWCRLPNQFERKAIGEKATASEARALRALRDPEKDARVVLDSEIEGMIARGDKEVFIDEIVGESFLEDHIRAVSEIAEEGEDQWDTIDEDRERLRALEAKPEDDRSEEEFTSLNDRIAEHTRLVNERRDLIQAPKRQAVQDKSVEELAAIVREARITQAAEAKRREDYLKWELYICTMAPKNPEKPGFPSERAFGSIDHFAAASPEQLEAITETVTDLEKEAADNLKGSS
jgi:hypothetical protein